MEKETSLMILEYDRKLGTIFVESGFFADAKSESEAIVKILAGREVGLKPIEAMTGIHIIKGKITFGANMMAAAVKKSEVYDYRVTKHTTTECAIDFFENSHGKVEKIGTASFSISEAEKITHWDRKKNKSVKLTDGDQWKNYPKAMLFARALSAGVRYYCPDVFGHSPVYVPEEMGANVDEDGDMIDITPKPPEPDKTTQEHTEPPEKSVIPRNPLPYTKKKVVPLIATETASNALQIPDKILDKMQKTTIDDAFDTLMDIASTTNQLDDLKKIVLKHCPEYFDTDRTDIPEATIAQIIKDASGVEMKEE